MQVTEGVPGNMGAYGGMARGAADLRFFGRDRFVLQVGAAPHSDAATTVAPRPAHSPEQPPRSAHIRKSLSRRLVANACADLDLPGSVAAMTRQLCRPA